MTFNLYKPGTFFPMSYVLLKQFNRYNFEVTQESHLRVAPQREVVAFLKTNPDVLFDLLKRVFSGLDGVLSRLEHSMTGDALAKLATILVITAKRFGTHEGERVSFMLKLTHQDLAALSGLSRETVSRLMVNLKHKKVLDYTNTAITIFNQQALEDMVSG